MASSLKPGLGGESPARLKYNATRLRTHAIWMSGARKIWEADLLELPLKQIKCQDGFFSFDLHAAEIKTFLLEFATTGRGQKHPPESRKK